MPVKDCMTGSPFCPDDKYEEFHDPILSEHEHHEGIHEPKQRGIPKQLFTKHKGEPHGKFYEFADTLHTMKNKTIHHM